MSTSLKSSSNRSANQDGLTLVEIMVAIFIFAISVVTIVRSQTTAGLNYKNTQFESLAALLAQHIMVQVESKYENKKFAEGTETDNGEGEGIFAPFKWTWTLTEVPFELPSFAAFLPANSEEAENVDVEKLAILAQLLNENLKKALKELSVTVKWIPFEGAKEKSYSLTTHLVDLTVEPTFPGAGIPGGGGEQGGGTGGNTDGSGGGGTGN